jgi:integrase
MAREKGYVFKDKYNRWFARTSYRDETGKYHNVKKVAKNRTHAKEVLKQLLRELDDHGGKSVASARMTFGELADYYDKTYLIEAQYVGDRKVAGLRSCYDGKFRLEILREYFGIRRLREITHSDLEKFRIARLGTKTKHDKQRSIATVNRELGLLRRVLNVAVANGWIHRSPFTMGKALISVGDEKPRERILTREEEERMLAACTGWRAHLRPILICALDTGMRRGELFKLVWSDVDFDNKLITIRAFNTKTMRQRQIGMTERLARELAVLYAKNPNPEALLFGIGSIKGSWNKVRRQAGVTDLRFHDLRHTYATRLVSKHLPLSDVGRVLGHTQPTTTYRYTNLTVETARRAADALDELHNSNPSLVRDNQVPMIN